MQPRVLVDGGSWGRAEDRARLAAVVEVVELEGDAPLDEAEFAGALGGCRGMMKLGGRFPPLTRAVLSAAPALELVSMRCDRFGHGIDLEAAWERGIRVVDTDNIASAPPVAEWVLALTLLCLRNAASLYRQMMAGDETWADAGNAGFTGGELTGKRVGLIGCGHVGQRLIELLAPFRVDLRVCDPYMAAATADRLGIERAGLDDVLRHAEILVVQVPLTPKTTHLIGERELALLGRGKILVNCSRGRVLDQAALIRRLEAGDLIAGLDVFDPEPLPRDSPLRRLPNAFLTPHVAWHTPESRARQFACAAREVERYFRGEPLEYELTPRLVDIRHGKV
jgi:phosphoglycerate dehydrogenase-like enzyme